MVFIKGTLSPNVQDHYAHYTYDASIEPLDYCIESAAGQKVLRLNGLKTNEWDLLRGEQIRASFMDGDNLVLAYMACLKLCGKLNRGVKISKENYMLFTRDTEWMSDLLINRIKNIS